MYKINPILKCHKKNQDQNLQLKSKRIVCLDDPIDDDSYKIYYIESQDLGNKWYRVIATAFDATSCSCDDQTKNPYQSCTHMKKLDEKT